jgi:hypothetical protein
LKDGYGFEYPRHTFVLKMCQTFESEPAMNVTPAFTSPTSLSFNPPDSSFPLPRPTGYSRDRLRITRQARLSDAALPNVVSVEVSNLAQSNTAAKPPANKFNIQRTPIGHPGPSPPEEAPRRGPTRFSISRVAARSLPPATDLRVTQGGEVGKGSLQMAEEFDPLIDIF